MRTRFTSIAAIIVTYNSADVLETCLRSLPTGFDGVTLTRVLIVDNASTDESLSVANACHDLPVHVIPMGRNAGYAAAINAGMTALENDPPDAVFVLNPDCTLHPAAAVALADALAGARRGIAVPRLLNPDGTLQPSLRRTPTLLRAVADGFVGGNRAGRFAELITDPEHYDRPGPAVWATGAAMLISFDAATDIGPWDEDFLLYGEEVDFALRAADRGWTLWYEPAAALDHVGGESGANPVLNTLLAVNRVKLYRKRHGPISSAVYYGVVTLGELGRALSGRRPNRAAAIALLRPSRRLRALPSS